jgi:hypothetical protein
MKLDECDISISVHDLIGVLATAGDMAGSLGKLGGVSRSDAKRVSAWANGANGGRPRKTRGARPVPTDAEQTEDP